MFSCAHEIGHHKLGHGTKVDEYLDDRQLSPSHSPEERSADLFVAYLLMPRPAVMACFKKRGWNAQNPEASQAFRVSVELGVGYDTLLWHMSRSLEVISYERMESLKKMSPKTLRSDIVGHEHQSHVAVIDDHWGDCPVDLEVGDLLTLLPNFDIQNDKLVHENDVKGWQILRARKPGITVIESDANRRSVRIARQGFCGSAKYRYLEDPDGD